MKPKYDENQNIIYERKVTARINNKLYTKVNEHFHHGQQTMLFRHIFESLASLIDAGKFDQVTDYLYKKESLTLPKVEA